MAVRFDQTCGGGIVIPYDTRGFVLLVLFCIMMGVVLIWVVRAIRGKPFIPKGKKK